MIRSLSCLFVLGIVSASVPAAFADLNALGTAQTKVESALSGIAGVAGTEAAICAGSPCIAVYINDERAGGAVRALFPKEALVDGFPVAVFPANANGGLAKTAGWSCDYIGCGRN